MDRRDFLKTVAITGAALTIQRSEAMEVLYILSGRHLHLEHFFPSHRYYYSCSHLCNGMETWTDMVQYDLSRRNNIGVIEPIFIIQSPY